MFSREEIVALLGAIWSTWVSALTGVVGLALTVLALWWPDLPHRRIFSVVGVIILMISPVIAWRDEYRSHRVTKAEIQPNIALVNTNAKIEEVKNMPVNILTLDLEFKNIGKSVANEFTLVWVWAVENNMAVLHKDQPQTIVNPINPNDIAPLPLQFSIPVKFIEVEGKQERAMKPEQIFIYLFLTYKGDTREDRHQELWIKYKMGSSKGNHQTMADKARFEPYVRKKESEY